MAYVENPARIYLNFATSANGASAYSSTDPLATYRESRSIPILADVSLYKFSVVRCSLTGNRNFPLLQASIEENQPDPWRTTYKFALQLNVANLPGVTAVPPDAVTTTRRITIQVYNAVGTVVEGITSYIFGTGLNTTAACAAALQTRVRATALNNNQSAFLQSFVAQPIATGSSYIRFTSAADLPLGYTFTVTPYVEADAQFWGFNYQWPQTALRSEPQLVAGTVPIITLPFPCSYVPSSVTGRTFVAPGNIQWQSQIAGLYTPRSPMSPDGVDAEIGRASCRERVCQYV